MLTLAWGHALLVLIAVLVAALIGVVTAIGVTRAPRFEPLANAISSIGLTIPSFALVGILLPVLGLGFWTALVCVGFYAIFPVLRNAVVGLEGVNADLLESAKGMGMGEAKALFQVRLPLAWPVILAGLRVSTQMSMGVAAIAAYVLGPGFGAGSSPVLPRPAARTASTTHRARPLRSWSSPWSSTSSSCSSAGSPSRRESGSDMTATDTRSEESSGEISGAEIRLENVTKRYAGQQAAAVDGLSLTIPPARS